jgi:hypothetical protein
MAYPVPGQAQDYYGGVAPTTAYSGTFIPELWSGKLI